MQPGPRSMQTPPRCSCCAPAPASKALPPAAAAAAPPAPPCGRRWPGCSAQSAWPARAWGTAPAPAPCTAGGGEGRGRGGRKAVGTLVWLRLSAAPAPSGRPGGACSLTSAQMRAAVTVTLPLQAAAPGATARCMLPRAGPPGCRCRQRHSCCRLLQLCWPPGTKPQQCRHQRLQALRPQAPPPLAPAAGVHKRRPHSASPAGSAALCHSLSQRRVQHLAERDGNQAGLACARLRLRNHVAALRRAGEQAARSAAAGISTRRQGGLPTVLLPGCQLCLLRPLQPRLPSDAVRLLPRLLLPCLLGAASSQAQRCQRPTAPSALAWVMGSTARCWIADGFSKPNW